MLVNVVVLVLFAVVGFVGSRAVRRPQQAAQAASVARAVGGTLGARKGLSAPELQRACFSEMVRHVRVTRQGRTHAPSSYVLRLHPDDLAIVDEGRRWFTQGLVGALRQAAADNGWVVDGATEIAYEPDPSRRPGVPAALAVAPEEPAGAAPSGPPPAPTAVAGGPVAASGRGLALVRSDTGERISLGAEVVTIGRSRDRAVMVDDSRVSRAHAHIEPRKGGWALIDDGSANGTRVNGQDLPKSRPCTLRVGDVLAFGPVELKVVPGGAPTGAAGTRALDDSDRNRISGEVLPPKRDGGR
ncbi:DUF3662 and FHA domain-containing protein [Aquihabitans sp. G128]|uniref:FhaA domain-containing protein n=1 Tax=Aquihabitans sp. G128 TaxID=2849779 RepID=UPI001C24C074|nr:FhaA domain-containing protein [Aquihabitans sp. G128]QXC62168.1 DUF3662 and FHA domain-containing protein [Aquihabitans sp. G128]